ncbi:SprT family zinc-dependent metalloprotease [Vibrio sp.]|nr:SprT family zinc-dependent metalloprotease [Vibrio sp.]
MTVSSPFASITTKQQIHYLSEAKHTIKAHIELAQAAYSRSFCIPSVNFNVKGKTAGKAYLYQNEIRLNLILMHENFDAFCYEVIPHEVAHLITFSLYGKVKPHGKEWKTVMEGVFKIRAKTTHSFDIRSVQGTLFPYHCQCTSHQLTIRRHNKVQRGETQYLCRQCNATLQYTN